MSSYSHTLDYLYSLHRFGIKLGLEVISDLLGRLGDPHKRFPTLHIGGTNGKGSSAAMAASILMAAGYRVGLYTSPHLVDFRERIQVQGSMITPEQVCYLTDRIRAVTDPHGALTFFECTTAMAFQYFADQQVDIGVIEVGMGGRFDATNVLSPLGVLITTVALEHEQYLGETIEAIAWEKAGILVARTPVVLGPMPLPALKVIDDRAQALHASVMTYGQAFRVVSSDGGKLFDYHGMHWNLMGLRTNLLGHHQRINAANALALLEAGAQPHFPVSESAVRNGLDRVVWPGRLDIVARDPLVILDGAHNPSAGMVLFDFLQSQLHDGPDRKLIMVIGMMADKQHRKFLHLFQSITDGLILTKPHMERAASPQVLASAVDWGNRTPVLIDDPIEAVKHAQVLARSQDILCVTGSLFLIGEVAGYFSATGSSIVQV